MFRRLAVAVVVVVAGFAGTGCSVPGIGVTGGHDEQHEAEVAADADATAAEIIEAGRPQGVAAAGDVTMVVYGVSPEDDEGAPQSAWRLYDARHDPLADGSLGRQDGATRIVGVGDGFLLIDELGPGRTFVDTAGRARPVQAVDRVRATRRGDVALWALEGQQVFYRPADHATYRLRPLPAQTQTVVIDGEGRLWAMVPAEEFGPGHGRAVVLSATAGTGPLRREVVRLDAGSAASFDLVAGADRVVFSTFTGNAANPRPHALLSRGLAPADRWTPTPVRDVPAEHGSAALQLTGDDRVLLSGRRHRLQQADGSWQVLDVPGNDDESRVVVVGDGLYALSSDDYSVARSDDDGARWTELAR